MESPLKDISWGWLFKVRFSKGRQCSVGTIDHLGALSNYTYLPLLTSHPGKRTPWAFQQAPLKCSYQPWMHLKIASGALKKSWGPSCTPNLLNEKLWVGTKQLNFQSSPDDPMSNHSWEHVPKSVGLKSQEWSESPRGSVPRDHCPFPTLVLIQ